MKCSYCGHELNDGAEFCEKCGMILGFADDKKGKDDDVQSEYTQNIFQALDFDDSELDIAAMELPVSDYEETAQVSYNIPEYVSSPEDETAEDHTEEPQNNESEEHNVADEVPSVEAEFEAPQYTPVPDVVISAKKASDVIKESNHVKKESRKKKKQNKKVYTETYNIENIPLEQKQEDLEKENEEAFKEAVKAPEIISVTPVAAETQKVIEEEPAAAEEPAAEDSVAFEEAIVEKEPITVEEPVAIEEPTAVEEPAVVEESAAVEEPAAVEDSAAIEEIVADDEAAEIIEENEEVIEPVEEQPVVAGLFEDIGSASEAGEYEEDYEDITPVETEGVKTKKSKKGIVIAALIFVLCVLCAGAYALKDYIPVMAPTENTSQEDSTVPSTEESTEEETTEEQTTEEESTEETTEGDVTTEDATVEDETTTEKVTTEEPTSKNEVASTTKPTTTEPATTGQATTYPITTKPATTKPTTTNPTTTKPATTKPTTTNPTTTKPAATESNTTTDPYGINDVTVKKPSSYIESYTGYVTAEGLNMRSKPSVSSDRVLYLSKGADVKVLAKEDGFLYVYSNRYGVYGWVSASYISTERPVESTSKIYTGTVLPDVKTSEKVMYTTYSLNIRKGPSTSYPSVQIIATGYPVKVLGSKSGVSGWVYVTDLTYGVSGWVSTAYLK